MQGWYLKIMTLLIGHRNDPPMCELGIAGTVKKCRVTALVGHYALALMKEINIEPRTHWCSVTVNFPRQVFFKFYKQLGAGF